MRFILFNPSEYQPARIHLQASLSTPPPPSSSNPPPHLTPPAVVGQAVLPHVTSQVQEGGALAGGMEQQRTALVVVRKLQSGKHQVLSTNTAGEGEGRGAFKGQPNLTQFYM